jgi:hypothetical protein
MVFGSAMECELDDQWKILSISSYDIQKKITLFCSPVLFFGVAVKSKEKVNEHVKKPK